MDGNSASWDERGRDEHEFSGHAKPRKKNANHRNKHPPWTAKGRRQQRRKEPSMDWSSREREKHQRNQFLVMLSRPTTYLGMGDPRSVSISALIQKPPLRCCRRGVHPSSMAATASMAVALVPLPLSVLPTDSLALWRSFCCARWCRVWVWETDRAKRGRGIDCFYRQGGSGKKKQSRAGDVGREKFVRKE